MEQENRINGLSLNAIPDTYDKNFCIFITDYQRDYRQEEKFNGYAIETNKDRSFFLIDIPCHPDFVGEDLPQVMYQVEHADNKDFNEKLSQVVPKGMSKVEGADLEQVIAVFSSLQKAMSMAELMEKFGQVNRTRFKRTCLDILINTGLATPTVPDKPNSRFQKYVLTEKGKQLLSECKSK